MSAIERETTNGKVIGTCDARFASVLDAFLENFAQRDELGASVFQFKGFFSTKAGWDEVMTSGIYADAVVAERDARSWVEEEAASP
jgi:hypothetical protein